MPNEREPMVIDKETTFHIRYGTKTGVLVLNPICGMTDCILLSDCTGHVGSMRIEPDRVAEAVRAETERIRACARAEIHGSGELSNIECKAICKRLDKAIDAKPAPVSEFNRGFMKALRLAKACAQQLDRKPERVGLDELCSALDDLEPTDAK